MVSIPKITAAQELKKISIEAKNRNLLPDYSRIVSRLLTTMESLGADGHMAVHICFTPETYYIRDTQLLMPWRYEHLKEVNPYEINWFELQLTNDFINAGYIVEPNSFLIDVSEIVDGLTITWDIPIGESESLPSFLDNILNWFKR